MKITVGIDEAGRGCILGPLVVGMVALNEEQADKLSSLGVKDSKKFPSGSKGHDLRKKLADSIMTNSEHWMVKAASAEQIDFYLTHPEHKINLNDLEQCLASACLSTLPVHYYGDPRFPERVPSFWPPRPDWEVICDGAQVFGSLQHGGDPEKGGAKITAVNNGESFHVAVAAASIIAKVARDQFFLEIRKKYEEFEPITGNGYGNPGTYSFLKKYQIKNGNLPVETRKSFIKI